MRFRMHSVAVLLGAVVVAAGSTASAQVGVEIGAESSTRAINSQGQIDYRFGILPSRNVIGSVFEQVGNHFEPVQTLLANHSRGVEVVIDHGTIGSMRFMADPRILLPMFDGQAVELAFVLEQQLGDDTRAWFGQIAGLPKSDVILVEHEGVVAAEIRDYANSRHYQIRLGPDGRQMLYEVSKQDAGAWCAGDHGAFGGVPHQHGVPSGTANLRGTITDPIDEVDLMTIVTAEARAGYGLREAFETESLLAVLDFNLRSTNSGAGVLLRLVRADWDFAAGYSEASTLGADLEAMQGAPNLPNLQGVLYDQLQLARETYRPDLVAMIRENGQVTPDGTVLGRARTPPALQFLNPFFYGFSVNVRNGSLPLVGDIFAHEVGHNFGGQHDLDTLLNQIPPKNPTAGELSELSDSPMGWRIFCEDACVIDDAYWHTTMAYGRDTLCGDDVLVPYFSNPFLSYDATDPCGVYPLGALPGFIPISPGPVSGADVAGLMQFTRSFLSDYETHATLSWAAPGFGSRAGGGTNFMPFTWLTDAVNDVQGGHEVGIVRAIGGVYEETTNTGGPVVLNNGVVIEATDGVVVIN